MQRSDWAGQVGAGLQEGASQRNCSTCRGMHCQPSGVQASTPGAPTGWDGRRQAAQVDGWHRHASKRLVGEQAPSVLQGGHQPAQRAAAAAAGLAAAVAAASWLATAGGWARGAAPAAAGAGRGWPTAARLTTAAAGAGCRAWLRLSTAAAGWCAAAGWAATGTHGRGKVGGCRSRRPPPPPGGQMPCPWTLLAVVCRLLAVFHQQAPGRARGAAAGEGLEQRHTP